MRLGAVAAAVSVATFAVPAVAGAATASVTDGKLNYTAGPLEANVVTIDGTIRLASPYGIARPRITDLGAVIVPGPGCTALAPNEVECGDTRSIAVALADGDDSASLRIPSTGGHWTGPFAGAPPGRPPAHISGDAGNDHLQGGGGTSDTFVGGEGADVLVGGDGLDVASYLERTSGVAVTLDGRANDGEPGENDAVAPDIEAVLGGAGNDTLIGNAGVNSNFLDGGPGDDVIDGRGGNDHPEWSDMLAGGAGADRIRGCRGCWIGGGPGNDIIRGAAFQVSGEAGNDIVVIVGEAPEIYGGPGDDVIRGSGGANFILAGPGSDRVFGGRGNDDLYGDRGRDELFGGPGADYLSARDRTRDAVSGSIGRDAACVDRRDRVSGVERRRCRPS